MAISECNIVYATFSQCKTDFTSSVGKYFSDPFAVGIYGNCQIQALTLAQTPQLVETPQVNPKSRTSSHKALACFMLKQPLAGFHEQYDNQSMDIVRRHYSPCRTYGSRADSVDEHVTQTSLWLIITNKACLSLVIPSIKCFTSMLNSPSSIFGSFKWYPASYFSFPKQFFLLLVFSHLFMYFMCMYNSCVAVIYAANTLQWAIFFLQSWKSSWNFNSSICSTEEPNGQNKTARNKWFHVTLTGVISIGCMLRWHM